MYVKYKISDTTAQIQKSILSLVVYVVVIDEYDVVVDIMLKYAKRGIDLKPYLVTRRQFDYYY